MDCYSSVKMYTFVLNVHLYIIQQRSLLGDYWISEYQIPGICSLFSSSAFAVVGQTDQSFNKVNISQLIYGE